MDKISIIFREYVTKEFIARVRMNHVPAVREIIRFPKPEYAGDGFDMYEVEHMHTDFTNVHDYDTPCQTYVYLRKDPLYLSDLN